MKILNICICLIMLSGLGFGQEPKPQPVTPLPPESKPAVMPSKAAQEPRIIQLSPEQQAPFENLMKERDEIYNQYNLRLDGAWIMLRSLLGLEPGCELDRTPDNKLRVKCLPKPDEKPKP